MLNIWQFNRLVSRRLLRINLVNLMAGIGLQTREGFWQGIGAQAVGWAFINILIAVFGSLFTRRRLSRTADAYSPSIMAKEARNLRRLLWINTGLDVLYMLGGRRWAQTRGQNNEFARGTGMGIVFQGLLLFVFDLIHALRVPDHRES